MSWRVPTQGHIQKFRLGGWAIHKDAVPGMSPGWVTSIDRLKCRISFSPVGAIVKWIDASDWEPFPVGA